MVGYVAGKQDLKKKNFFFRRFYIFSEPVEELGSNVITRL